MTNLDWHILTISLMVASGALSVIALSLLVTVVREALVTC